MVRRAPNRRPSDAGPRKTPKSFTLLGESFLDGIRVAHKRLQEYNPPPFRGYLKSEKMPFWHIFRTIFSFSKLTKCCKLQHFCVLTSFAGAMQRRRKCCKYPFFLDQRCTKNTANTSVFESKQKDIVNYSIFAKNGGIYTVFAISRKRRRHETL